MKEKFDAYSLCTVTFGQKSSKLIGRLVYCWQLYSNTRHHLFQICMEQMLSILKTNTSCILVMETAKQFYRHNVVVVVVYNQQSSSRLDMCICSRKTIRRDYSEAFTHQLFPLSLIEFHFVDYLSLPSLVGAGFGLGIEQLRMRTQRGRP